MDIMIFFILIIIKIEFYFSLHMYFLIKEINESSLRMERQFTAIKHRLECGK